MSAIKVYSPQLAVSVAVPGPGAGTIPTTGITEFTGSSKIGLNLKRSGHAVYSFASDGGAISTITPVLTCTVPANAIVMNGMINPTTAPVGVGASVAVGVSAGSSNHSILGATAITSLTLDALVVATCLATPFKTTAAGLVTVTISGATLTAGIIEIFFEYYHAQNA